MSDDSFIREVDDEMRQDKAQEIWTKYGNWLIAAAVAIVVATAAFRGWEYYTNSVAAKSGDQFMAAINLSNDGKHDDAIASLEKLVEGGSGQYPALAKLRIASEQALRGDEKQAIASYDQIAEDSSFNESFRLIAQLRAGLLAVDLNDVTDVTKRLEPLAKAGLPFRHSAREGMGLANYKAGKFNEALTLFNSIANDAEAGASLRERANIMLGLLAGQGISQEKAAS